MAKHAIESTIDQGPINGYLVASHGFFNGVMQPPEKSVNILSLSVFVSIDIST